MWDALKRAEEDVTGALLLPRYPEGCQGNGLDPRFEICCDECDYLQL